MYSAKELSEFDSTYAYDIQNVLQEAAEKKANAIKKLAEKCMLTKKIWHELHVNFRHKWNPELAFYQFYITKHIIHECNLTNLLKLMDWKLANEKYRLSQLQYPNNNLDDILINCEYFSDEFLSRKIICQYKKMKILYEKIVSVEDDSELWFKTLLAVNDVEFVRHNVEYRLGEDLTDKMLWKLYIEYLEKCDIKVMLHTFSKYCRFFTDDKEMREKYEEATEKYGKIKVSWTPLLPKCEQKKALKIFVYNFRRKNVYIRRKMFPEEEKEEKKECNLTQNRKRKALPYFTCDFVCTQNFSFKIPFMRYIFHASDGYTRQSLFKSCKYFFSKHPFPICYKFSIKDPSPDDDNNNQIIKTDIVKESIYYAESETSILNYMNLHVTTFFNFESSVSFSNIMKKLYRCTAKVVSIVNTKQFLTLEELKFLIGHGNVIYLDLCEIRCRDEQNGKDVPLEDILRLTPKIQFFDIWNPIFSSFTAQIMANLPFQNKIRKFWFFSEKNELEPYSFSKFIVKNASDDCEINYSRGALQTKFDRILQTAIQAHWKGNHKPYFL